MSSAQSLHLYHVEFDSVHKAYQAYNENGDKYICIQFGQVRGKVANICKRPLVRLQTLLAVFMLSYISKLLLDSFGGKPPLS